MLDIMYEVPKDDNIGAVTITRAYVEGKGGPGIEIRSEKVKAIPMKNREPDRTENDYREVPEN